MWKIGSWREVCTCDAEGNPQVRIFGTCGNCNYEVLIELSGAVFDYSCDNCGTMGAGEVSFPSQE